jgi:hypothetical protein
VIAQGDEDSHGQRRERGTDEDPDGDMGSQTAARLHHSDLCAFLMPSSPALMVP